MRFNYDEWVKIYSQAYGGPFGIESNRNGIKNNIKNASKSKYAHIDFNIELLDRKTLTEIINAAIEDGILVENNKFYRLIKR